MKNSRVILVLVVAALASSCLAQSEPHHHDAAETVGTVSFPISCAADTQAQFERGVALLHSFEYQQARNQFQDIEKKDSRCSMAYWGQAMSLYHQLWERPSEANLQLGAELLTKARAFNAPTARERDYVQALTIFFTNTGKLDHHQRADAYAKAMQGLYRRHPQDREAAVFYALSLLASGSGDVPDLSSAKAAVAILNNLFKEQPNHPGIAHYIIHSCDNPAMASLALPAARKYASIAPASPHAVHMPSHIFARLGLWQDDIDSNLSAIRAADKMATVHLHVLHHKVHSVDFLEYAYLQIGDDASAQAQIDALASIRAADLDPEFSDYLEAQLARGPATYALERRQWKTALQLDPLAGTPPYVQLVAYWGRAVAAGHLHDSAAAQDALKHYDDLVEATRKGNKPYIADDLKDEHDIVRAWAKYASGETDEAVRLLRSVADTQDKVGKRETELPAREMLADMLLDMQHPQEALEAYETSLRIDPNRLNGLYGAAQAADLTDQKQKAAGYYGQLLKNCDGIRSDRPELTRAKTLLAAR